MAAHTTGTHAVVGRADHKLRAEVCDALLACGFDEIAVEVAAGHVVLHGAVDKPEHIKLVGKIARAAAPDAIIRLRVRLE